MKKHRNKIWIALAVLISIWSTIFLMHRPVSESIAEEVKTPEQLLTHRQEVWLNVLEWCESRGVSTAINPKDRDGTPSYGGFQFKPSTLNYFAERYDIATTTLMDYDVQRAVVTQMIIHKNEIKWNQQFPDCVKKNGLPPD